ncbi:MAG: zinc ribbon domain-containing protein [Lachnospiraceae bacterium]|nr:zinc ribbon domain-containing protein [Lachnospiraceae bacterium]MDD3616816.1 zinc ribbon domain-containing protein [Lachnospiraceae bacterium]
MVKREKEKCRICGAELEEEALFCDQCGAHIIQKCPKCGAKAIYGHRFCEECGQRLEEYREEQRA